MLRMGLLTGAGLMAGASADGADFIQGQAHAHQMGAAHAQANPVAAAANAARDAGAKPVSLAPYVDALPRLPVIRPPQASGSVMQVRMREIHQKLHRDLPPTRMWGYNGTWPGPTFETRSGQPITV